MSALGLWPANLSNFHYSLVFGYFCYHMILEYLDLFLFIDNLQHVLLNLTENMAFSPIFVKMLILRLHNQRLGELITEAKKDFNAKDYTIEEAEKFVAYHAKSKIFMKLLIINTALTASSYYVKPISGQMEESEFAKMVIIIIIIRRKIVQCAMGVGINPTKLYLYIVHCPPKYSIHLNFSLKINVSNELWSEN